MKKITLLTISIISFILSPLAIANTKYYDGHNAVTSYSNNNRSFTFTEKGITFSIFQNGEFDFYINRNIGLNTNAYMGGVDISFNSGYNYDTYVQYDDFGAIIQVENVPIYYDYYGRVSRIGNINLNYYSNRLSRLGGMRIYYNTYGHYSHYSGYINNFNRYYVYHPYHNYFARPYWNNCIVSYNPYRRYYKPYRYDYYYGKKHYNKHYNKHHYNKKRSFRNVDSRISNYDRHGNKVKRGHNRSQERKIANNNTSNRRQNTSYRRSSQQTQKRQPVDNRRKTVKRTYKPSNNIKHYKTRRTTQSANSRSRNIAKKNDLKFKNDVRNRSSQVKRSRNSQYGKPKKQSVTRRDSNMKRSKINNSSKKHQSKNVSKRPASSERQRGKRSNS